jgi:hypothetical protein
MPNMVVSAGGIAVLRQSFVRIVHFLGCTADAAVQTVQVMKANTDSAAT